MDFAVTSPLQPGYVAEAAREQLSAATSYESDKLSDRNTAERCRQHGFKLVPMVAESCGGWGNSAQKALRWLIHANAGRTGRSISQITVELYSSLSIIIMRANARALLARIGVPEEAVSMERPAQRARTALTATA